MKNPEWLDFLSNSEKFTFLVGAGVSMNPPSNLPSALGIVDVLIDLSAPEEEIENVKRITNLRYEWLIEALKEIDPKLHFLDYFSLDSSPNMIHLFLAASLIAKHYVVTTNFDYFIEKALISLLPPEKQVDIVPIITKEDYLQYNDPSSLTTVDKYPIYKIHGSKRDIIKNIDTSDSLITSYRDLGSG